MSCPRERPSAPRPGGAPGTRAGEAGLVRFLVHDTRGRRLDWKAFRRLQENGRGEDGDNDMLLDPSTLRVRTPWPLYEDGGDPVLDRPGGPVTLSMAWPTAHGYSMLLLDLPGAGTYVFTQLAARQAVTDLQRQVDERPGYVPSPAFSASLALGRRELAAADASSLDSDRGRHGALAYEAAVGAQLLLLREYGVQFAAARAGGHPGAEGPAVTGFTLDAAAGSAPLRTARALAVDGAAGAVRVVFDLHQGPDHYRSTVEAARTAGVKVVGQILDSSQMAALRLDEWQRRVAAFVDGLPGVDGWEVGNEVNGNWLGRDVPAKIAYAARYVKQHTRAATLVTLYWQLGEDDAEHSVFTWLAAVPAATFADVDEVGLSLYPEEHPMGAAFDRAVTTLHTTLPGQRVSVSELGYWDPDLGHTWWWGSPSDPEGEGRRAVADLYARAILGYPYSAGGTYWWYFLREVTPESPLYETFASVRDDVRRTIATRCHP